MADEPTEAELREARLIVTAAIAAAGKCESTVAWRGRVNTMITEVVDMLGPKSPQMRRAIALLPQNVTVFPATYLGYDTEFNTKEGRPDRSGRWQVRLAHPVDKRHPDGIQRIRTEMMNTPGGKAMANKLADLKEGDEVFCWKVQEDMKSGDGGETMAVLYHIRYRPPLKDAAERSARAQQPAPEEGRVTSSPPSGASIEMEAFNVATEGWDGKVKAALVNDLRFADLFPPTVDNVDRMIAYVKDWKFE